MNGKTKRPVGTASQPSRASKSGLDWLNFLVADVQIGFGPFVSFYLAN